MDKFKEALGLFLKSENQDIETKKTKYAKISDFEQLMEIWENTSPKGRREKIIEARMVEIVKAILPSNIPEWFKKMISGKRGIPDFVEIEVIEKAQEIYEKM